MGPRADDIAPLFGPIGSRPMTAFARQNSRSQWRAATAYGRLKGGTSPTFAVEFHDSSQRYVVPAYHLRACQLLPGDIVIRLG